MSVNYNNLLRHLKKALADVDPETDEELESSSDQAPDVHGGRFYAREGVGVVSLSEEGSAAFADFLSEAQNDPIVGTKVGMKPLENCLYNLLCELQQGNNPTDAELTTKIKDMMKHLRGSVIEWQAYVPIDNFVLKLRNRLQVGKVAFHKYGSLNKRIQRELAALLDNSQLTDEEKRRHKKRIAELFVRQYAPSEVIAVVTVNAEESRVAELVAQEVDAALNLLRCYTHLLSPRSHNTMIGLRGGVVSGSRPCLTIAANGQKFHFNQSRFGALVSYELTLEKLKHLKKHCAFAALSAVLAKDDETRTGMEKVLAVAVRWIGRGVNSSEVPEQVIYFSVALERLLTGDKEEYGDIADRVARRTAFLLADTLADRLKLYKRMKQLYNLRSGVAHAGRTDIALGDAIELESHAVCILIEMADALDEWKEHQDFVDWTKECEFS